MTVPYTGTPERHGMGTVHFKSGDIVTGHIGQHPVPGYPLSILLSRIGCPLIEDLLEDQNVERIEFHSKDSPQAEAHRQRWEHAYKRELEQRKK